MKSATLRALSPPLFLIFVYSRVASRKVRILRWYQTRHRIGNGAISSSPAFPSHL